MRLNSCCSSQARVLRSFVMENLCTPAHCDSIRGSRRYIQIWREPSWVKASAARMPSTVQLRERSQSKGGSVPWMILMPVLGNGERMEIGLQLPIRRRRPFEFECRSISLWPWVYNEVTVDERRGASEIGHRFEGRVFACDSVGFSPTGDDDDNARAKKP